MCGVTFRNGFGGLGELNSQGTKVSHMQAQNCHPDCAVSVASLETVGCRVKITDSEPGFQPHFCSFLAV